jgi:hypothetical protein
MVPVVWIFPSVEKAQKRRGGFKGNMDKPTCVGKLPFSSMTHHLKLVSKNLHSLSIYNHLSIIFEESHDRNTMVTK